MSRVIEKIAEILRSSMGLDYNSIGISSIQNAANNRSAGLNCESLDDYLCVLEHDEHELKTLIENVVIPETWFFRDIKPFNILAKHLAQVRSTRQTKEKLNLLSLPSSTGEEPYSIAMTLLDSGWSKKDFNIDACDISDIAINKARKGIYTNNSFRINDDAYISKYFTLQNDMYHIDKGVKECVNFQKANMFNATDLPYIGKYDVIFCRNLIIYFDTETQENAFSVLARLLKNDGLLILGHAETANASKGKFRIAENETTYAYCKSIAKENTREQVKKSVARKPSGTTAQTSAVKKNSKPEITPQKAVTRTTSENATDSHASYEKIMTMANNGKIADAIKLCSTYLEHNEKDADANYLMAVLHDADSNILKAEEYLRKAIYLDPEHVNAIIHMAVIAERNGDTKTAERMRLRARRVEERNSLEMDKMA